MVKFHAHELSEQMAEHVLQVLQYVLLVHKTHFHVHLGELRLPVGPQVLVSEASSHLIVLVDATHHQQLLKDLRGLGQSIEQAVVDPGGNQIVPGTLGGGLCQNRSLHREKTVGVQIVLGALLYPMAEFQPGNHVRAAQVQVPVFQPQGLVAGAVLHGEGQGIGLGDHLQLLGPELHGAGFQPGIDGFCIPLPDIAPNRNDRLVFQPVGGGELVLRQISGIKYHLEDPLAVP